MADKRHPKSDDYAVGFGKPPADHRFQSGVSGNPRGRPKGSHNVWKVLEHTLLETVVVNEGGRRKTMTKLEATLKQVTNKAASGDLAAAKVLFDLARAAEQQAESSVPANSELNETDQKVMQRILEKITGPGKEEEVR